MPHSGYSQSSDLEMVSTVKSTIVVCRCIVRVERCWSFMRCRLGGTCGFPPWCV